jgi:hypothetical protein
VAVSTANCVEASNSYLYDNYLGNATLSQQTSSSYYQQSGSDRTYGWIARDCSVGKQ